ncbi:MAG: TIGR01212 family radical SAM protein [Desulfovibrionales bacterium]|nr:MAG: TIGR01212 family radical SAM protein [Desulfovibrionales bacterium]
MDFPYYTALSGYLRSKYGVRVQKIPLDAGSTCPNRDGTLARQGCLFCAPSGAGTGLFGHGLPLAAQWAHLTRRLEEKYSHIVYWAYLQSYSNTYGSLGRLEGLLDELSKLPGARLLGLGTRPDCLDKEKFRCIKESGFSEIWLDIGLQSANDQTLRRIRRGHDFACFARCVESAHSQGLRVCVHVMHGLPGETSGDFMNTIEAVNGLPIAGIKFHNLFVARGSGLERVWRRGGYVPPAMEVYVRDVIHGLECLRPDVLVHRLNADPRAGELLAPTWAGNKRAILDALHLGMETVDLRQGRRSATSTTFVISKLGSSEAMREQLACPNTILSASNR